MLTSPHWSFDLQEFTALYLVIAALVVCFYFLASRQQRAITQLEGSDSERPVFLASKVALVAAVVLAVGLALTKRVGLQPLALSTISEEASLGVAIRDVAIHGLLWGLVIAIVFEVLTRLFFANHLAKWNAECHFENWRTYAAASIGAAVSEESLFRLLLFPLGAWLLGCVWHDPDGLPTEAVMWFSMVAVTLLFASTHLIVLEEFGGYTLSNIVRGLLVFSIPGLLLGLAFWQHGLETAMLAHASGLIMGWLFLSTLAKLRGQT